jgi:hypothetical protein
VAASGERRTSPEPIQDLPPPQGGRVLIHPAVRCCSRPDGLRVRHFASTPCAKLRPVLHTKSRRYTRRHAAQALPLSDPDPAFSSRPRRTLALMEAGA